MEVVQAIFEGIGGTNELTLAAEILRVWFALCIGMQIWAGLERTNDVY